MEREYVPRRPARLARITHSPPHVDPPKRSLGGVWGVEGVRWWRYLSHPGIGWQPAMLAVVPGQAAFWLATGGCPRQDSNLRSRLRRPVLFTPTTCRNTPSAPHWGAYECHLPHRSRAALARPAAPRPRPRPGSAGCGSQRGQPGTRAGGRTARHRYPPRTRPHVGRELAAPARRPADT